MTPEEIKVDKYYWKKFSHRLAEIEEILARQGGVCYICKRPPGERRLSVDHDHAYDRVKIVVKKHPLIREWFSAATIFGKECKGMGATRALAREGIRFILRRESVRGILCLRCNKGIQMFEDSKAPLTPAERFDRAAKYFRDFRDSRPDSEQHETHPKPSPTNNSVCPSSLLGNQAAQESLSPEGV